MRPAGRLRGKESAPARRGRDERSRGEKDQTPGSKADLRKRLPVTKDDPKATKRPANQRKPPRAPGP
jgi:hypothetical protein